MCNMCPPLPDLDNATLTCSDDFVGPNTTCSYNCDSEHFYFTGQWQYFCRQNGKWSQEPDFACHPRNMEESVLIIGGLLPSMWPEFISSVDKFDGAVLDNSSVPVLPAGTAYLTAVGLGSMAVTCFGEMSCHDRGDRSDRDRRNRASISSSTDYETISVQGERGMRKAKNERVEKVCLTWSASRCSPW